MSAPPFPCFLRIISTTNINGILADMAQQPHIPGAIPLLTVIFLAFPHFSFAESNTLNASISSIDVPQNMVIDKKYQVKVEVKNTGAQSWTADGGIQLGLGDNSADGWGKFNISLNNAENIKPGESKVFETQLRAPSRTGLYPLSWQMNKNNSSFGETSSTTDVVVETLSNRGKFISQVVPQNMQAGKSYDVIFQYKNIGNSAWSKDNGYKLSINNKQHRHWDTESVELNDNTVVAPGDIATFRVQLKAPDKSGNYSLQWRMLKGKGEWFGDPTPLLKITVQEGAADVNAEFVFQNLPGLLNANEYFSIFDRGEVYPVTLTFKNNGTKPWKAGSFWLASRVANSELIWSTDRIQLKNNETILPGEMKSFSFKVIAPLNPGIYDFQWQMKAGDSNWIGEPTDKVVVTVK